MRAAGALYFDDGHRAWTDSSQTKFAMFLVVLSCNDSEPLRPQCNATKLKPCLAAALPIAAVNYDAVK